MQRLATTVVCLVGGDGGAPTANNVRVWGDDDAAAAWSAAIGTKHTWFLHRADPLSAVAAAWERLWAAPEETPRGELEVLTTDALARLRARSVGLPDYYVLLGEVPSPSFHLTVLGGRCPTRVLPVAGDLLDMLPRLLTGPWWPDPAVLLDRLDHVVPGNEGMTAVVADATTALITPGGAKR
jgi:hypothetical protein